MIKINKTVLGVSAFSLLFTGWWAWELDAGPLIRRHTAPDKLVREVTKTFLPYLKGRNISSIRFGKKNAYKTDRVPVSIVSDSNQEWLIPTAGTGPVLITVDNEAKDASIYWEIPQDMAFEQANGILSDTLWDILSQYDNIISVKSTFNE